MQDAPAVALQVSVTGVPAIAVVELEFRVTERGEEPFSGTAIGTLATGSVTAPVGVPALVGEKVTEIMQAAEAASEALQLLELISKGPAIVAVPSVSELVPVLVNVAVIAALVLPIGVLANVSGPGATWISGTCSR